MNDDIATLISLPNADHGNNSKPYDSSYYRHYICEHGYSLQDLYNRIKMYDPYAQFHADQNTAADTVCLHSHSYYEIIYCVQVTDVSYIAGSQHYFPKSGDLICISPGLSHRPVFSDSMSTDFCRFILNINTDYLNRLFRLYTTTSPNSIFDAVLIRPNDELSGRLRELFDQGIQISQKNGSQFEKIALVLHILTALEQASNNQKAHVTPAPQNDLLEQFIQYIDSNYDKKLTLQSVASHFYVSQSTISHLCSEKLQESFYQYVQQRRLSEAQRLITNGAPLEQISSTVGFSNYHSFYRAFKLAYGISPKEYRNLL